LVKQMIIQKAKRCLIGETLRGRAHNYSRSHKNDDKIYIKDFNDMFNINMEKKNILLIDQNVKYMIYVLYNK